MREQKPKPKPQPEQKMEQKQCRNENQLSQSKNKSNDLARAMQERKSELHQDQIQKMGRKCKTMNSRKSRNKKSISYQEVNNEMAKIRANGNARANPTAQN